MPCGRNGCDGGRLGIESFSAQNYWHSAAGSDEYLNDGGGMVRKLVLFDEHRLEAVSRLLGPERWKRSAVVGLLIGEWERLGDIAARADGWPGVVDGWAAEMARAGLLEREDDLVRLPVAVSTFIMGLLDLVPQKLTYGA